MAQILIYLWKQKTTQKIKGEFIKIPGYENYDFFLSYHRKGFQEKLGEETTKGYRVSEVATGALVIEKAKTKEAAIKAAQDRIDSETNPVRRFSKSLDRAIADTGEMLKRNNIPFPLNARKIRNNSVRK